MAQKIRLDPVGKKGYRLYKLVVVDARAPRGGGRSEKVGTYDPNKKPAAVQLNVPRITTCLNNGAQPTDTVREILSSQGFLLRRHLQKGVDKGVITQKIADKRFQAWEKIAVNKKNRPYQLGLHAPQAQATAEAAPAPAAAPQKTAEASKKEATQATTAAEPKAKAATKESSTKSAQPSAADAKDSPKKSPEPSASTPEAPAEKSPEPAEKADTTQK